MEVLIISSTLCIYFVDFILNNSNFVEFVLLKKIKAKLVKFTHVIDTEICLFEAQINELLLEP